MRPPVFRWLWRVPGVMCSNKGLALYMPKVKLSWQKICSLNSVFFQVSRFHHPFPLNLQALHKLSVIVAVTILILQLEVLRMGWLSCAKDLRWVHAVTVKVLVPSPNRSLFTLLLFWWQDQVFSYLEVQRVISLNNFWGFQGFVWCLVWVFLVNHLT